MTLPVTVEFDAEAYSNSEIIAGFSSNRRRWGFGGDALTIYLAPHRKDFSFRTGVFEGFP